ncbi:MAG TPA: phosphoketolase family protein [Candidatus Paceibacterota bacterium]|nr:phosphoketolase family protein [Candidatus Paceibacterota bacterium]HPT40255.1 phosphoketolase family protein [Candidatus Paceibacterota bacterium]
MNNSIQAIKKYVRLANYVTVSQIYLQDNFLLGRELNFDDIKSRLLGHWGTCPGINFVYANLNYLIKKHNQEMLFILGPGHGFPALQANLFIEGTLRKFYPEATLDESGLSYISKNFSWPYGFPSHSNPGAPGVILEGGELGYSLSTAYGAILDNPNLIATCLVGDGEAETGPLSTSWHLNKFIDPKENGAVLPILHLNGYKISGPTVFGRMSNKELKSLFYGYGYDPIIVAGLGIYAKMQRVLEKSLKKIKSIQSKARKGKKISSPRWPMIILRTPKGWTGIKELDGRRIEDNFLSHQVIAKEAKTNIEHLEALGKWLQSYKINELYSKEKGVDEGILSIIPEGRLRMGEMKYAFAGKMRKDLILPNPEKFAEDANIPGTIGSSSMRRIGLYLREVFELNAKNKNFRLMSPDETYSNKLDEVFKVTKRAFVWPKKKWDEDLSVDGRVIEMLSEHSLQGLAQGYVLTGRHMVFASYEAFVEIVASMADQYAKFLKIAREIEWRGDAPSFNYILTSSGWRQEHNGFSHQNPGFISNMLQKGGDFIKAYFPADGTSALVVLDHCLKSKNCINIIVAGKTLEPRWLTPDLAKQELDRGMMIWNFASDKNPDIVFSSIGDYMTKECLAAIDYLKKEFPDIKTRLVNVVELSSLGFGRSGNNQEDFDFYFTKNKPVIFNFHGYPETIKHLLFGKGKNERFFVHGYIENGSTTTPFDMQVRNKTDRFSLVIEAFRILAGSGKINKDKAEKIIKRYEDKLRYHDGYIRKYGVDMEEIENWQWKRNS